MKEGVRQVKDSKGEVMEMKIRPQQIVVFCSGLLFLASTTYDVHRSIKNNDTPPSAEQMEALEEYVKSVGQSR